MQYASSPPPSSQDHHAHGSHNHQARSGREAKVGRTSDRPGFNEQPLADQTLYQFSVNSPCALSS